MSDTISVQHFRNSHWDSDSVCGINMAGARTPQDCDPNTTTCIACKAIQEGRPLFAVSTVDEDGYSDTNVFNTAQEQIEFAESCMENGAESATMCIFTVEMLKDGEW